MIKNNKKRQVSRHKPIPLTKFSTGVPGLDEITRGGLPQFRTTLITGEAGSGKSVLAMQILLRGSCMAERPGIFVAFEESSKNIKLNVKAFGWSLGGRKGREIVLQEAQLSPDVAQAGEFDLSGLLAGLALKAKAIHASCMVFDGIDVLLGLLSPVSKRRELHRLRAWLAENRLSGILTSKRSGEIDLGENFDRFLSYLSDCVISLGHRIEDQVSARSLRVVKYRGSGFSENEFPMIFTPSGLEIFGPSQSQRVAGSGSLQRVTSGVKVLDGMLRGGYYRASVTLISGSPGTAKSTLAASFLEGACRRGERSLYLSFDELEGDILRNMKGVGLNLQPYERSGMLTVQSLFSEDRGAEQHLATIRDLVLATKARCVVIDPLSALIKSDSALTARRSGLRLLRLLKERGVTTLCTSLMDVIALEKESALMSVSTIADTWIHVANVAHAGERNRTLTIVKSRGTDHSNQVREIILSNNGVTLSEVFTAEGEVLLGTARWEKERAEKVQASQEWAALAEKRRTYRRMESEVARKIQELEQQLASQREQLEQEVERVSNLRKEEVTRQTQLARRRGSILPHRNSTFRRGG